MKKIIFLILVTIALNQHNHDDHDGHDHGSNEIANTVSLSGKIIDSKTEKPVPYATITLSILPENTAVDGIMCDENGEFLMIEITPGKYNLSIESIGYEKTVLENYSLNEQEGIKRNLGTVELTAKALGLDAINVIEKRSVYEFETDKMVYNASDDIISSGGTAEDVLRKVPMVTINLDGEVSLRGNSNVKILIDGRDSRFGSEVDNIPSSLIDQVEVITSPSAKYDPEGMAGIINIKLKKGEYGGLNGKIKLNGRYNDIASFDKMNGITTFLNYRSKKFNLYTSLNFKNRFNIREGFNKKDIDYYYNDPADGDSLKESFHYNYTQESTKPNKTFKVGGDYFISEKLTLNSEISWGSHINNSTNIQTITKPTSYVKNSGEEEDGQNYDIEGVIGIDKRFDNPDKELTFQISFDHAYDKEVEFTKSTNPTINLDEEGNPNPSNAILINDRTPITETYNKMNIDFSYKLPINENSKIEIGYDGRIINTDEIMDLQITDTLGYTLESDINSLFKRDIHGAYFEYENKFNELFSIKPSLRIEYVTREVNYEKIGQKIGYYGNDANLLIDTLIIGDYSPDLVLLELLNDRLGNSTNARRVDKPKPEIAFYPDFHFTYNFTNKRSIQLGISKRVERPGSSGHGGGKMQIRPFPRNLYAEGNLFIGYPFLKSAYTTTADISYKTPIPMGFMMLNSHYSYIKDPIKWDSVTDYGTTKNVTTFANAETGNEMGTDFFIMMMGQTLGGGITKSKFNHSNGDPDLNEETTHMNMFLGINFPEKYIKFFDFEFGLYWMKMTTGSGDMFGKNGTTWANIGLAKSFLNNQFNISLKLGNLLNAGGFQMDETYNIIPPNGEPAFPNGRDSASQRMNMSHSGRPRTLTMNLTYSFGKMEDDKRRRKGGHDHDDGGGIDMGGF